MIELFIDKANAVFTNGDNALLVEAANGFFESTFAHAECVGNDFWAGLVVYRRKAVFLF